jgi:hypothetical protein
MKIFWINFTELFKLIITLAILWTLWYIYNNLAWIIIFTLSIIFLYLLYKWIININNKYNYFDTKYRRNIWIVFIILSLIPWYFGTYMLLNYKESNTYIQEKSIWGIIEIWKFALSWRKLTMKNIAKVAEENIKNDLKDKAVKDTLDSLSWSSMPQ